MKWCALLWLLLVTTASSEDLRCPGSCALNHYDECLRNAKTCSSNDHYCKIAVEHAIYIKGNCQNSHLKPSCDRDAQHCNKHSLIDILLDGHHLPDHCTIGCCETQQCLDDFAGRYMVTTTTEATTTTTTTQQTTTTPAATTTTAAPPPTSKYDRFKVNCTDQMEPGVCAVLRETQDVCHNPLSLDLCPDTCGICKAVQDANCHDTVLDGGCQHLADEKQHCQDPLAEYTCPVTCGLCDQVIDKLLQSQMNDSESLQ